MKLFHSFLLLTTFAITSQSGQAQSKVFANDNKVAINGYDVVAYFNSHTAIRGSSDNSSILEGTTYYFSSEANMKAFQENPAAYLPQYGGYCAVAMAMHGATVPADPQTFKIRDGKLYLFFNDFYEGKPFNTIVPWNNNEVDLLEKANANWAKL